MIIGGTIKAWDLLPSLDQERQHIHDLANYTRHQLTTINVIGSETNIIPIIVGDPIKTLDLKEHLAHHNINVSAIRSPTVPKNTDRLRIAIHANHTKNNIDHLIERSYFFTVY